MLYTVKQARRLADKTQAEMAALLGVSRDTYRKIEMFPEQATVAQARNISIITKIPVDQIFFAADSTLSRDSTDAGQSSA